MTQNQIRYLQAMEEARANRAKELENERSNKAKESEVNRSNLENERLARERLAYEKYGRSEAGQAIQAIKAVGSDVAEVVVPTANNVVRTITGTDATVNPVTGEQLSNPVQPTRDTSMVSHAEGNAPGAFDYKSDVATSKYDSMSKQDLLKEAAKWKIEKNLTAEQKKALTRALISKGVNAGMLAMQFGL